MKPLKITNSITTRSTKYLKCYFNEINNEITEPLTFQEEQKQFAALQNGCPRAKNIIIRANLRFVISVAKKYEKGNPCFELGDLINVGNIGMIKAVERFDYTKGHKFISYAVWWIRQAIQEEIKALSGTIKIPNNARSLQTMQEAFIQKFYSKNGYRPTIHQIAEALQEKVFNVMILNKSAFVRSIDAPIANKEGKESASLLDVIEAPSAPNKAIRAKDQKAVINVILGVLDKRERYIIEQSFGLTEEKQPYVLCSIGQKLGITRERVRQLKFNALAKLKAAILANNYPVGDFFA